MDYRCIGFESIKVSLHDALKENKPKLIFNTGDLHKSRSPGLEYEMADKNFKLEPAGMVKMISITSLANSLLAHTLTGIKIDWSEYNRSKLEGLVGKSSQEIVEVLNTNGFFGRSKIKTPDSEYFKDAMVLLSAFFYKMNPDKIKTAATKLLNVVESTLTDMPDYGNNLSSLKTELKTTRTNISNNIQSLFMVMNIALAQCYVSRQIGKMNVYNLLIKSINSSIKEIGVDIKECYTTTFEYSVTPAEDLYSNEGKRLLIRSGSDKDIPAVLETMLKPGVIVPIINNTGTAVNKPSIYDDFDLNLLINKDNINYKEMKPLVVDHKLTEVSDINMLMLNVAIAVGLFELVFFQLKVK